MTSVAGYRDADYDLDPFICKTASWNDGLKDKYRFVPDLASKVRRTSSYDEISRFYRYFDLIRSNHGGRFTWYEYSLILRNEIRNFDTGLITKRMLINPPETITPTPSCDSVVSQYATAPESQKFEMATPKRFRKRSFFKKDVHGGDNESISSMDSNFSIIPQTTLLKKMCGEMQSLAQKTYETVERITSKKPKYCTVCGYYRESSKMHRKCSQSFGDGSKINKPLTPGEVQIKETVMAGSMTILPKKTPSGSGESVTGRIHTSGKTRLFSPSVKGGKKTIPKLV